MLLAGNFIHHCQKNQVVTKLTKLFLCIIQTVTIGHMAKATKVYDKSYLRSRCLKPNLQFCKHTWEHTYRFKD